METRTMTTNLIVMLAAVTGRPIGDDDIPEGLNDMEQPLPYAIVMKSPSPGPVDGDYEDPESESLIDIQVLCVGATRLQCEWMSDKVSKAITARAGSGFVQTWTSDGCDLIDRRTLTIGAIVRSGPDVFNENDIYRIRIGRKGS